MKSFTYSSLLFLSLVFFPTVAMSQTFDLAALSVWRNENGSTLSIETIDPNTKNFTGSYINRNTAFSCVGTPYPVTGWVLGSFIAWSVRWDNQFENCNSLTSWAGFVQNGKLSTDWILVYQSPAGPRNLTGTNTFERVAKTESLVIDE